MLIDGLSISYHEVGLLGQELSPRLANPKGNDKHLHRFKLLQHLISEPHYSSLEQNTIQYIGLTSLGHPSHKSTSNMASEMTKKLWI